MKHILYVPVAVAVLLLNAACGAEPGSSDGSADSPEASPAAEQSADQPAAPSGQATPEMVAQGESLFRSKGCVACHKIGEGRLVGPDLAGVTERRDDDWILAMILKPDSMLRHDETAKELLAEYFTPMTPMGVTPEEARALLAFFESKDDMAGDGGG